MTVAVRNVSSMAAVVDYVCRNFGVAEFEVRGRDRQSSISLARRTAAHLMLTCCPVRIADIARELNRHWATIQHQLAKVKEDMERPAWRDAVARMAEEIIEAWGSR